MKKKITFQMQSIILNCVRNDDVEGLKLLLTIYPNFFQIAENFGCTILQRAISKSTKKVFDFLLSLDDCPINARNGIGETALEVALGNVNCNENFAISLVEKGADFNSYIPGKASVLHRALHGNRPGLAKLLIERGADLNCQDEKGETPLHLVRELKDSSVRNELLNIMFYFGADPLIPDNKGYRVIDYAFKELCLLESKQEHSVFYFFHDYCTDYDYEIPVNILFELLGQGLPIAPQMLKYITSVNLDKNYFGSLDCFFSDLFIILKPEYLKLLLEKFDYVIENIISDTLHYGWKNYYKNREKNKHFENFHLLFQSRFCSDIIKIINKIGIHGVINVVYSEISNGVVACTVLFDLIFVLLSYGANIYDQDVEYIYNTFGDCEFFRILLHMDIKVRNKNRQCNIMPTLLYNVHMDIETFLNAPHNYSLDSLGEVLNYFALPKLKNFCNSFPIQNEDVRAKVKNLPSVPLLVELARNEVRKFLIKKYKINNSMQFYILIKLLPISIIHEKIITLDTKLY